VYCLFVNVYCTAATGCQPNCSLKNIINIIYHKIHRTIIILVENWSLTLREEHRMRAFDNMMLRRVFGPKTDDVTVN